LGLDEFVTVQIFGTFNSSQLAQRRIQSLVVYCIRGPEPTMIPNNYSFQTTNYSMNYPRLNVSGGRRNNHHKNENEGETGTDGDDLANGISKMEIIE